MDIRKQLMLTHSKQNSLAIVNYIGKDKERYKQLINYFFSDDYRLAQRAAHALSLSFNDHPEMIKPYIPKLINALKNEDLNVTHKRNIVRILQYITIPEEYRGMLYNRCIAFIENPKEAIAVRAFAITVAYNITEFYKELKSELLLLIEEILNEPKISPATQNRAKKIAVKLKQNKTKL